MTSGIRYEPRSVITGAPIPNISRVPTLVLEAPDGSEAARMENPYDMEVDKINEWMAATLQEWIESPEAPEVLPE
jgi:hypothetical protein